MCVERVGDVILGWWEGLLPSLRPPFSQVWCPHFQSGGGNGGGKVVYWGRKYQCFREAWKSGNVPCREPQGEFCCHFGKELRKSCTWATTVSCVMDVRPLTPCSPALFSILSWVVVWPLTKSTLHGLSDFLVLSVLQSATASAPKTYVKFVFFPVSPPP